MVLAALLALGAGATLGVGQTNERAAAAGKVRIGTYDNRSVAVAYAASRYNPIKEKWAAYERAKAADDRQAVTGPDKTLIRHSICAMTRYAPHGWRIVSWPTPAYLMPSLIW